MKKVRKTVFIMLLLFTYTFMLTGCDLFGGSKPKLQIYQQIKQYYAVGDSLDVSSGLLRVTNGDDISYQHITSDMVTGFSTATPGARTMVITYDGAQVTVSYKVFENVQNDVYYRSANSLSGTGNPAMYMYFKFNHTTKTMFGLTSSSATVSGLTQSAIGYHFTQTVDFSGITLTSVSQMNNYSLIISIFNITSQTFTLRQTKDYGGGDTEYYDIEMIIAPLS